MAALSESDGVLGMLWSDGGRLLFFACWQSESLPYQFQPLLQPGGRIKGKVTTSKKQHHCVEQTTVAETGITRTTFLFDLLMKKIFVPFFFFPHVIFIDDTMLIVRVGVCWSFVMLQVVHIVTKRYLSLLFFEIFFMEWSFGC